MVVVVGVSYMIHLVECEVATIVRKRQRRGVDDVQDGSDDEETIARRQYKSEALVKHCKRRVKYNIQLFTINTGHTRETMVCNKYFYSSVGITLTHFRTYTSSD